ESLQARLGHLGIYVGGLASVDARDDGARAASSAVDGLYAAFRQLSAVLVASLGETDAATFEQLAAHPDLEGTRRRLTLLREQARLSMPTAHEVLAADLGVDGLDAWGRLYSQVTGAMDFELRPGVRVPLAQRRSLMQDADPAVRAAALVNANAEIAKNEAVFSAALNAIAGTRLTLQRHRGVADPLVEPLRDAALSRGTLETMFAVCAERAELPRRYLRLKARLLGVERLGFQDLSAPLPVDEPPSLGWDDAVRIVIDAFDAYDPAMGDYAREAVERRWIDAAPRPGKRPGAYCASSRVARQSRVFLSYNDTLGDVQTLAHELGHAWHSHVMADMRPWATLYPMTLAETASTFAECLVGDALLNQPGASASQRRMVLDLRLERAAAFMLNTPMRFEFEKAFYAERRDGEVSSGRLCALMADTQRRIYGDTLAEDQLDPWFWASKLHFFLTDISFYNFPYTFGYLFSTGVFARARDEGPGFRATYRRLLRATGSATAEEVAREVLGVELGAPDFWHAALDDVARDLEAFEAELAT
ncbi:MAG: M3 family oligoendopeptidase, partial [Myxococcales bacterium]|nr:M3 family oligoendopeptidase [Myxococcales bacterium]